MPNLLLYRNSIEPKTEYVKQVFVLNIVPNFVRLWMQVFGYWLRKHFSSSNPVSVSNQYRPYISKILDTKTWLKRSSHIKTLWDMVFAWIKRLIITFKKKTCFVRYLIVPTFKA